MKIRISQYISKAQARFKAKQIQHWLLLALGLFLSGFFVKLAYSVLYDPRDRTWIQAFDNQVLLWVAHLRFERLTLSMIDITSLGSVTLVVLIGLVFLCAFLLIRDYLRIFQLFLASLGAGLWTWIFKHIAERPRPSNVSQLVPVSGHSFPSGHSLAAAALYMTFALMAANHVRTWKHAVALQGLATFVIACVAFSRVYLGVHYPTDVASGALFGTAWAYFVAGVISWIEIRKSLSTQI